MSHSPLIIALLAAPMDLLLPSGISCGHWVPPSRTFIPTFLEGLGSEALKVFRSPNTFLLHRKWYCQSVPCCSLFIPMPCVSNKTKQSANCLECKSITSSLLNSPSHIWMATPQMIRRLKPRLKFRRLLVAFPLLTLDYFLS